MPDMNHVQNDASNRREFLKPGTAATVGMFAGGAHADASQNDDAASPEGKQKSDGKFLSETPEKFRKFSRTEPSYGGPPGSDNYLGKLTPGYRKSGLEPVPLQAGRELRLPLQPTVIPGA